MFFYAFTPFQPCFELSGRFKHVFLIRIDTTIIQEYVKKVEKKGPLSRLFGISNGNQGMQNQVRMQFFKKSA